MIIKINNKKAQTTMFIVAIILILVAIGSYFLVKYILKPEISPKTIENPENYIDSCVSANIEEAIDIMLPQGGYISPNNYVLYNGQNVQYLCYTNKNYYPCINQEPLYIEHLEKEIKEYITPGVIQCFADLKKELESKNYNINLEGDLNVEVILKPRKINTNINKKLIAQRGERTVKFANLSSISQEPLYDLANVAIEIANQEAEYCSFEYVGYMQYYTWVNIDKFRNSDDIKIYSIQDRDTGRKLDIAIRSCNLPPGF